MDNSDLEYEVTANGWVYKKLHSITGFDSITGEHIRFYTIEEAMDFKYSLTEDCKRSFHDKDLLDKCFCKDLQVVPVITPYVINALEGILKL